MVVESIGWPNERGGASPNRTLVLILILAYMLMANVVLVNLLIAQMGSTYERMMEKAEKEWVFNRAHLILEFKDSKGALPPPLNIFGFCFSASQNSWFGAEAAGATTPS